MIKTVKDEHIIDIFTLEEVIDLLMDYDVKHFEINTEPIFGEYLYGYIDYVDKNIYINRKLSPAEMRETIIHEFVHGIKMKYGIPDKEEETTRQARKIYKDLFYRTDTWRI